MKNNNLYQIKWAASNVLTIKRSVHALGLFTGLFTCYSGHAQLTNEGDMKVTGNTILSVYMDYNNTNSGNFINDGDTHIFENWKNEGIVSYNAAANGKTFFTGDLDQLLEGSQQSDFQNIIFNNLNSAIPFHLATTFSVGKNADFIKGIINASDYNGLMVFNENAVHQTAGDQSFVDGRVRKLGDKKFEFPVGDEKFFRPSFHALNASQQNVYTTQYFYKNSALLHSHEDREPSIVEINTKEYWEVRQDQGDEKIILSLTLDKDTTPDTFFEQHPDTELAIVRWDEVAGKWVNDGGVLSDPIIGEPYANLLTGQVRGYGLFTMALVTKTPPVIDELIVYNAISPNDDGKNDSFHIKGIDAFPDNSVEIYNRWGVKVFDATSYNESDNMFKGYSDGRATINRGEKLPTGTYFYILKYNNGKEVRQKAGYLYVNNQ